MNVLTNAVSTPKVLVAKPEGGAELRQVVAQAGKNRPVVEEGGKMLSSPSPAATNVAIADVSAHIAMVATSLSITVDEGPSGTIIQVTDRDTDEVIRQIPPEEIVNLARYLRESAGVEGFELADTMKGLLLDSSG
jgi:flagellar protein FlaG